MTPEQRFIKMEHTLNMIIEVQGKHESAIRDLIVVSQTLLRDSIRKPCTGRRRLSIVSPYR